MELLNTKVGPHKASIHGRGSWLYPQIVRRGVPLLRKKGVCRSLFSYQRLTMPHYHSSHPCLHRELSQRQSLRSVLCYHMNSHGAASVTQRSSQNYSYIDSYFKLQQNIQVKCLPLSIKIKSHYKICAYVYYGH